MKKIMCAILGVILLGFTVGISFAQDVYVHGYYRRDGTYVRPHYRTRPDGNLWNNYSTKGNINPYTGKRGYTDPYSDWHKPFYGTGRGHRGLYGDLYD